MLLGRAAPNRFSLFVYIVSVGLGLGASSAAPVQPGDPRVMKTPLCRVLLKAFQELPKSTADATWPQRAVELARLRQPLWEQVDALSNLEVLKNVELESHFRLGSPNGNASVEVRERYWQEQRSRVESEINTGALRLYRSVDIPLASTMQ